MSITPCLSRQHNAQSGGREILTENLGLFF
nr:MAG TPA: hypothetical protein [Caudoviricetes sp.]